MQDMYNLCRLGPSSCNVKHIIKLILRTTTTNAIPSNKNRHRIFYTNSNHWKKIMGILFSLALHHHIWVYTIIFRIQNVLIIPVMWLHKLPANICWCTQRSRELTPLQTIHQPDCFLEVAILSSKRLTR